VFDRVPRSGEAIAHENFKFRVEKMKGARILNLHLAVINSASNGDQEKTAEET
jgi:Mg2+/Co2+ transporter CorC